MWSKDVVELLIVQYKEHDNLYNARNPAYLDRTKRSKSLLSICHVLKTLKKDITVEDIKKKIHTLRAQFIKETREISYSKRNAVSEEDVYVPKLWCYSQLQFLKSHCTVRKPEANFSETNESDSTFGMQRHSPAVNSEIESQPSYKANCDDGMKKRKISPTDELVLLVTKRFKKQEDSYHHIASMWTEKLSKMDRNQRIFAEKTINDVLLHGELGLLNYNTSLTYRT